MWLEDSRSNSQGDSDAENIIIQTSVVRWDGQYVKPRSVSRTGYSNQRCSVKLIRIHQDSLLFILLSFRVYGYARPMQRFPLTHQIIHPCVYEIDTCGFGKDFLHYRQGGKIDKL